MMTRILMIGVLAVLFGAPQPVFAQSSECLQAEAVLDEMLLSIPNTCEKDEDCGGFYARLDTCVPPVMMPNKAMFSTAVMTEYVKTLSAAQAAGKDYLASRPTCEHKPFKPACQDNVCVNEWAKK